MITNVVLNDIQLAADIFNNEDDLVIAFDNNKDKDNDEARLACCYLLMACESHERKA